VAGRPQGGEAGERQRGEEDQLDRREQRHQEAEHGEHRAAPRIREARVGAPVQSPKPNTAG